MADIPSWGVIRPFLNELTDDQRDTLADLVVTALNALERYTLAVREGDAAEARIHRRRLRQAYAGLLAAGLPAELDV